MRIAEEVARSQPGAPGSSEALAILAEGSRALGRDSAALESAGRLVEILDPSHPFFPRALYLLARTRQGVGDALGAAETLVGFPPEAPAPTADSARQLLREALETLPLRDLAALAERFPDSSPLLSTVAAQNAVALALRGDSVAASRWAEAAMAGGPDDRDGQLARAVLEGTLEEVLGRPARIGVILPRSGVSPGWEEIASGILEGVQVAVERYKGELRRELELEVLDDRGQPVGGKAALRTLEAAGVEGVVGPLLPQVLAEAVAGWKGSVPIVAPLSYLPPEEAEGVLSLSGPDPHGAELVARYAWDLGLERVAVVRPETDEAEEETRAFREEFEGLGGKVTPEITYEAGTTFFQPQFEQVATALPDGLFLPLPPSDIRLLAPQFTFYGLDTLGIQLLGTGGWTSEEVVEGVDSRHTDGVIATTTRIESEESEGFREFRAQYEALFRKTLRSRAPAYGYDAAALLLEALVRHARSSRPLVEELLAIQSFPGATGVLTVRQGRIVRAARLVRIQNHELIYISSRDR